MRLEIQSVWSPDLNPPSEGAPPNIEDFNVFMQVAIGELKEPGREVFHFFVCSPNRRNAEWQPAITLRSFTWAKVHNELNAYISICQACQTWDEVVEALRGKLEYSDA